MSIYNKKTLRITDDFLNTYRYLRSNNISTICVEGNCPNSVECFSKKRATFLIMGDLCTRGCYYCSVKNAKRGRELDFSEIKSIIECIKLYGFEHIILTSVTRDDLADGGSGYFADSARMIRENIDNINIELLTPDFEYKEKSIQAIVECNADILAHNIESAKSKYKAIRKKGSYIKSLKLLEKYAAHKIAKSGLMLGFGESIEDVQETVTDLASSGVKHLSIGQYLPPLKNYFAPVKIYSDEEFESIRQWISDNFSFEKTNIGFYSRSSYLD